MPVFDTPLNTNDQSLDRVLAAGLPVALLVYRAPLPGVLEDALKQAAKAHAGDLLVAKVNAAENPQTAARISEPLPALIAYQHGDEVARAMSVDAKAVLAHVKFLLGKGPRPEAPRQQAPRAAAGATGSAGGTRANAPSQPVVVSDATFQREVLQSDLPVLVDLWAPWCGPCRMIAPVVEKLAQEYAGRLKVAKLNVDENPATAGRFQVQGIPTLLVFRGGQVVDRIVGAAPEPTLRGHVEQVLRAG